jgi:hypothetical protein
VVYLKGCPHTNIALGWKGLKKLWHIHKVRLKKVLWHLAVGIWHLALNENEMPQK